MSARFQSFQSAADPAHGAARVARLRAWMSGQGLDAFLVPRADEHQGEYVAPGSERLAWLTGFTGSAGAALVLHDKAVLFIDGRYTVQVRQQTDPAVFAYENLIETPPHKWIAENMEAGATIGFDAWLHTIGEARRLAKAARKCDAELVAVDRNGIDAVWDDRPRTPLEPVSIFPFERAGRLAADKLAEMAETLRDKDVAATVLTDPASIAWAFNIRGRDVAHTPLPFGFAILHANGEPDLFMDRRKMSRAVEAYLTQLCALHPPAHLDAAVKALGKSGATVGLDPALAAEHLRRFVADNGGTVVDFDDPARLPRACKNAAELAGARNAQRRDGAAMCRFLAWLDVQMPGTVSEIDAVLALETARIRVGEETQMPLRDISFDTISGAGPHGAIIHYRVTTASNRTLGPGELYLVDSGGQYEDGTTDITRTVAIGAPTPEMRARYTIVLKGLIAISTIRFPEGTRGCDLDPLARAAHWKVGVDYAHGTGHGVGAYLSVHEGPQRIARTGTQVLKEGMILSNEPGYYKEGAYGIRLENLVAVTGAQEVEGGDKPMHGFETLTLAPFDRRLIDTDRLTGEERAWLDAYHARVLEEIGPFLDTDALAWLKAACAAVDQD